MKLCRLIFAMVAAGILMAGCGGEGAETTEKQPSKNSPESPKASKPTAGGQQKDSKPAAEGPREAWVTLDGYHGPENVGILVAEQHGYFAEAGISITVTSPASPANTLEYVVNRTVDFGVVHQPQVVMARAEGEPIVAVGSLIPRPTAAMIWLRKSKIRGVADLKGKTIAIPGLPFQEDLLESVLARAGLTLEDVEVKNVEYQLVPALVKGRADAIFGGSANLEGAELEAQGLQSVITPVGRLGIPAYEELVVIARPDRVSKEPKLIRDFMSAVARGAATAVEDPKGAAELIENSEETDPRSSRRATEAAVEATLPLLSGAGHMNSDQASQLIDWMYEQELIRRRPPTSDLLTNRYLASQP